jgi:beta-galactosidase
MTDVQRRTGRSRPAVLARRQFVWAAVAGVAGVAAGLVTARRPRPVRSPYRRGSRPIAFGTGWLFGPASADSSQPGFDDSGLQVVTLPHTVAKLSWQEWDPASWEGVWVYRKHFDAPCGAAGMRVFVDFGAAMTQAVLTLNGHGLPGHVGGYLPFSAEITNRLMRRGNVLTVTLDSRFNCDVPPDRPPPCASSSVDFWQPGGLYREVRLRIVPQVFLADVFAKPVKVLDADRRQVVVQCTVDVAVMPRGSVTVLVELLDGAREISSVTVPVTISKPGQVAVTGTLSGLAGIALWDIDKPKLYTVRATLQADGAPPHACQVRIGFREASYQLDGFYLNGRRVKLFGVNRHQFYPFAGAAMPARVQRRDAEILRQDLNCNMVRCSHYPQSEAFFDACDELGLMAWEEIPGWGYFGDAAWQAAACRDVADMIIRDRNHPSIIVWGVMPNEAGEHAAEYAACHQLAHFLDDSRPTGGDGHRTDASFVFDVYSIHDYSHRIGPDRLRQPELEPPLQDVA